MVLENIIYQHEWRKLDRGANDMMYRAKVTLTEEHNVLLLWVATNELGINDHYIMSVYKNDGDKITHEAIRAAVKMEETPIPDLARLCSIEGRLPIPR